MLKDIDANQVDIVKIVEDWIKRNSMKTKQTEFLEEFLHTIIDEDGIIKIHPCFIDTELHNKDCCGKDCK